MKSAREIIGEQAPDDYILRPEVHAESLPQEAGPLKRILASPAVQKTMGEYRAADSRAAFHQRVYKLLGRIAITLQAVATVIGAAFILKGSDVFLALPRPLPDLTVVELVLVLVATAAGGFVALIASFQKWNESRASAELARINFFSQVASADEPSSSGEIAVLPLQLEYFRRYQLQIQIAYYGTRGKQHERQYSDQFRAIVGLMLISVTLLAANLFKWPGQIVDVISRAKIDTFIGVAVATLTTMLANLSLLGQDEANARRYRATLANLQTLSRDYLEPAREAAATDERDRVHSFVAAVNDQISLEHRQWLFLHEVANQPDVGPLGLVRRPNLTRRPTE